MTFKSLQDDLIAEVEDILSEIHTTNTHDEAVNGVKGYAYQLPVTQSEEDDVSEFFPYFLVKIEGGETKDDNDPWHVTAQIIFGIHDATPEGGRDHILIMCQRVVDRFVSEPLLKKTYRADQDIQFAVGDDDTYPFCFGGVSIKFSVPKIGRREPEYD